MTDHANDDHGTHPRLDELRARIATGEVDTLMVAFTDMQGRLMGKRVTAAAFLDGVMDHGAHVCTYLLGTDMEMSTPDGFALMNWDTGYGDYTIAPDWGTLRVLPWQDRTALVLGDVVDEESGAEVPVSPRTILKRQIAAAAELGMRIKAGSEFEYYLLTDTYEGAARKGFVGLERFGEYNEDYHLLQATKAEPIHGRLRRLMTEARIPIEFSKGEAAPGQHELNIRYDEVLESADRSVIFKHGAKEIAWLGGYGLTFMAKPDHGWTGSSGHLHMSAWTADDQALFYQRRRRALRHVRHDALVPGRHDAALPGAGRLLRAQHQLLQALRRRQLGARQRGLGPRQPHDRLPGRRPRAGAPHRVPLPGWRHERLSDVRRVHRGRAVRRAQPGRAAGGAARQRLRGDGLRAHATGALRGHPGPRGQLRRGGDPGRRTWSTTTSTRPAWSSRPSTRSCIPGSGSDTWNEADRPRPRPALA